MWTWKTILRLAAAVAVAGSVPLAAPVQAGNATMIQKRIKELDHINRGVVGRLPGLPRNGQVTVRARVLPDGTVLSVPGPPAATRARSAMPLNESERLMTLSEAVAGYARQRQQIRSYRDANTEGEYTPLARGLGLARDKFRKK